MEGLRDALKACVDLLWEILKALFATTWWALQTYPQESATVILAFGAVWFVHGLIRKWKPCPKGGRNTSKYLFKGTWSDRSCCEGAGRHLRVPARIMERLRHR